MKAAVNTAYGRPEDVIKIQEVEKPVPKDNEVLIKVHAASVNPLDWHMMRGTPSVFRLLMGLRKPGRMHPGVDLAGVVEAVGKNVERLKPGDAVFGAGKGTVAEYSCAPASKLAFKPEAITFEQAASLNVAGLTALQGLRDYGRVREGTRVLINGASGGVGTFAVQIAKWLGANVTAVCSTPNLDLVRSLGADRVIDYTKEDFIRSGRYDVFYDCIGNRSASECRRVLTPKGIYVGVGVRIEGGALGPFPRLLRIIATAWFVPQKMGLFVARVRPDDLATLGELVASGKVTPVIERCYTLDEAPQAMQRIASERARGKLVVAM
jgi:NADPH:quinone reductase-like Zn-dependent oxidoreductase